MVVQKTYPKILLLIFSSNIFFIILFSYLYFFVKESKKQIYFNAKEKFSREVNKLLELDAKPIQVALANDSNWDEFVAFFNSKNALWFNETLGNELKIYNVDYMGAYGLDGSFIIRASSAKIKSKDIISKGAFKNLSKSGLYKFYVNTPEGIMEIFGATVHPSYDTFKNKTKSSGYFFVGRLLDKEYITKLEKITNSNITLSVIKNRKTYSEKYVFTTTDLKGFDNKLVKEFVFLRKFDGSFENILAILYLIVLAFTISLIVNIFFTRKLVYYPLFLMTRALETGNKKAIDLLKRTSGEFRYIGNLFEENTAQKEELVKSKLKAEEGERLKATFLANLSHEIRTPMNAINGFTNLLMDSELDEDERLEYLKIIDKSGKNLVSIIDDLIEMSKIDSNQITPNYTSINLESCVCELYETIKITIPKSKEIDFVILKSSHPVEFNIMADEVKLKQVLVNLITNAIKFTDTGIVAFGYDIDKSNEKITFSIKDSGPGIDKNNHKYIFDRFKRVENDMSIKAGGLGLGLAISKAYVEMMGGSISVKSKIDKGSTFSFSIPLKYAEIHQITVHPVLNKTVSTNVKEGVTILIAEDDNINFLLFQKIVQQTSYTIIRAVNGLEAVEICLSNPDIDLVLMDIKMPIMDGFEALEKIKSIREDLTVIAQTAFASDEDEIRILKAGFLGYITKPIKKEILFETINQFLYNKQLNK